MAEQSAKADCYGLKILSEIMCQESKPGVRLMHREIKAHKRVLEEQKCPEHQLQCSAIVAENPRTMIQEHKKHKWDYMKINRGLIVNSWPLLLIQSS
jgi:hypothetical protein